MAAHRSAGLEGDSHWRQRRGAGAAAAAGWDSVGEGAAPVGAAAVRAGRLEL
jgi:hypothetical protein